MRPQKIISHAWIINEQEEKKKTPSTTNFFQKVTGINIHFAIVAVNK